jgi:hypothetical protein
MNRFLAAAALVAVIVIASHGTTRAGELEPDYKSNWATGGPQVGNGIWPYPAGAFAKPYAYPSSGVDPQEAAAWWFIVGTNTKTSPPNAWMKVRVRCYRWNQHPGNSITYVMREGGWVPPGAVGPGGGPAEAWVRCPDDWPKPYYPQLRVGADWSPWFISE